ncbi:hypothetical protein AQUSIP_19410 [Aquicella siphonis]|uniref:Uncharacterized protein n=1 Tax=Aquicella siphonis TaxID=254247 RepID=A0A5E4PJI5_9COXI|nr:hypothetical protein [Aquicella siphonis]VVC76618.1 hypothetical protein AQUSIP_19410 [Aquicella siphonis]
MPKIHPHDEIGPNDSGKMIIRGICFSALLDENPDLKAQIEDYLSARGTVGAIKLSNTDAVLAFSADEAGFIASLIDKFRALEFSSADLLTVTAEQTKKQRDEMVLLAQTELEQFRKTQAEKGQEVSFTGLANTIIENVDMRKPVSYVATLAWEDLDLPDLFAGMTLYDRSGYVPPTLPESEHAAADEAASARREGLGLAFHSMFHREADAEAAEKAIQDMVEEEDKKPESSVHPK